MLNEFKQWLERNSKRFSNLPILYGDEKDCLSFKFESIAPELSFTICESGTATVEVTYGNQFWDIIAEFDVHEQRMNPISARAKNNNDIHDNGSRLNHASLSGNPSVSLPQVIRLSKLLRLADFCNSIQF